MLGEQVAALRIRPDSSEPQTLSLKQNLLSVSVHTEQEELEIEEEDDETEEEEWLLEMRSLREESDEDRTVLERRADLLAGHNAGEEDNWEEDPSEDVEDRMGDPEEDHYQARARTMLDYDEPTEEEDKRVEAEGVETFEEASVEARSEEAEDQFLNEASRHLDVFHTEAEEEGQEEKEEEEDEEEERFLGEHRLRKH